MVYHRRLDPDWTMEFVSQGCLRVTGHQPADMLLNKRIAYDDLTLPDDRLWVREAIRCAVAEFRSFDLEYRIVHADGSVRWVWERGTGVIDAEGRPVALEGLIQDITKRKHAETMLREAERRYHGLFDNAIEGIFRTTVEGNYLDANPALAHIYGFESPQELSASLRDIGRQLYVDPQRRAEFMRIVKARGSVTGFESQVYRKNGDVIWISDRLKIDRSFVEHLVSDAEDATIVRTIIALGHNLGLKVVAEGVESAEQLRFLRSNLCDEAQGFLMGRPDSSRHLRRIFTRSKRDLRA